MTAVTLPAIEAEAPAARRAWPSWLAYVPLVLVLAAQAVYTIRLVGIGFLSNDEARYILAGHALIHELFHGGGSPYYETYYSGAPDVYSPLAAMADYVGGLAAVRLMSMCFMLTATVLLFLTARRLLGCLSGLFAAGIYAGLGMTQAVGRNAIYDALAFMLIAAAAYCAARARDGSSRWFIAVPLLLVAGYFTKYMTVLFDPVVILLASLGAFRWREIVRRTVVLGSATGLLLIISVYLSGSAYIKGMKFSLFNRQKGASALLAAVPTSTRMILLTSWHWLGFMLVLAFACALVVLIVPALRKNLSVVLTCAVAGTLVVIEAVHLGSLESSHRHDDMAIWFASISAGYLLALLAQARGIWRLGGWGLAIGAVAFTWMTYSQTPYNLSAASGYDTQFTGADIGLYSFLRPYLEIPGREFLLSGSDNDELLYDDHISLPWWAYETDDNFIEYPIPGRGGNWAADTRGLVCGDIVRPGCVYLEGPTAFTTAIRAHAFAVILLDRPLNSQLSTDHVIRNAADSTAGYVLVYHSRVDSAWIYLPYYQHWLASEHRLARSRAATA